MRKPDNTFNGIHGMIMRPASMTDEENDATMHSSDYSVKADFMRSYNNHIAAMQIVAECAKVFALKNWEKITDWTTLNVVIEDNTGEPTEYFNYVPRVSEMKNGSSRSAILDKMMERRNERDKLKHNPITSVKDVVLDPTDGDFSLVINEHSHLWISDDSVIVIADYIEKHMP